MLGVCRLLNRGRASLPFSVLSRAMSAAQARKLEGRVAIVTASTEG